MIHRQLFCLHIPAHYETVSNNKTVCKMSAPVTVVLQYHEA